MKRILAFSLVLASAAIGYACSSDKTEDPGTTPTTDGGNNNNNPETGPTPDSGPTPDGGPPPDGGEDLTANPIEGIAAPKVLKDLPGQFTDGPQVIGTTLYFSLPLATDVCGGPGILMKVNADGTGDPVQVRCGDGATTGTVGNSINKAGFLLSAERTKVTRSPTDGGAPIDIATQYNLPDGGGPFNFDTPNDLVARDDGTIYVTDPGYFATITDGLNHLIKIAPDGGATTLGDFTDVPRPNGIALSPDQTILYVGFTAPIGGAKPYIQKYTLKPDGTVNTTEKFAELPLASDPDGLAVDKGGNVYVAWANGINVYKSDKTRYGAEPSIPLAGGATGLTFSGKTLFITTASGKIYTATTKVTGIQQ